MVIAVDFDGTLHTGDFPNIGEIADGAKECMKQLKKDGHYLTIWTCRCGDKLTDAVNWLLSQGIPFDRINEHDPENLARFESNSRKIYAHLYIDDKQVGGLPSWGEIYDYVCKVENDYKQKQR
ncbi:hypothetical protein [Dysgonomonas sp. GY617]|uniref:hypothetical protein n=1 Tax=Dysgonomonas sp. GY617 TaxID=2780420 RepID=UPI0018840943|nr:hypothetical protein [Dysgonomonas sp. GY617]MBF0576620.1 hypothetical protein [Dysgonomonas sp. GY617]